MIDYNHFAQIEIKIGTITQAEKVEGSDKLLKLQVDFGTEQRQILTGIAKWYNPQDLVGIQTPFVVNLASRKMMGLESQGMILGIGENTEEKPTLLTPAEQVPNGSRVI